MGMTCRKPTSEPTKACLYIAYDPTPSPLTLALTFTARIPTDAFLKFQISMETLQATVSAGVSSSLLENEIREKHSYLSFQHPDRIGDAVRLFYPLPLWPSVALSLSLSVNDVKTRLKLIVERRNKIAHEADMDPSYPGTRWPITKYDVQTTINFIENVCESIHSIIT